MSDALARAVEAWTHESGLLPEEVDREQENAVRAAVSAALDDPDDRDWLAKVIFDRRDGDDIREWDDASSYDQEWFQCAADAVRDAIFGAA